MNPSELLSLVSIEYQDILGKNLCGIYVQAILHLAVLIGIRAILIFWLSFMKN